MAKQVIDIGSAANDGTGDPVRSAWDKANQNFTELYNHIGATNNPHGVTKSQISLGNLVNSLQVINAGNFKSLEANTLGNRPAAGTIDRWFFASDIGRFYYDDGTNWLAVTLNPVDTEGANFTVDQENFYVGLTASGFTASLPASADTPDGFIIILKDESGTAGGTPTTVAPDGADTIDGAASFSLDTDYGCVKLILRGTNWNVISYYEPVAT